MVEETKIFTVVEQMPMFPGGDAALMGYLRDNMHYPTVAAENGVQGRVVVGFVVERDGSIKYYCKRNVIESYITNM